MVSWLYWAMTWLSAIVVLGTTPPVLKPLVLELHLRVGVGEGELTRKAVAIEVALVELELDAVVAIDADRDLRNEAGPDERLLLPLIHPREERA